MRRENDSQPLYSEHKVGLNNETEWNEQDIFAGDGRKANFHSYNFLYLSEKTYELGNDYLLAFSVRLIKMIPISHSLQSIISKESGRNVKRLFSSIKIS